MPSAKRYDCKIRWSSCCMFCFCGLPSLLSLLCKIRFVSPFEMLSLSLNFCLQKLPSRYLLDACSPAGILTVTNMYCKLINLKGALLLIFWIWNFMLSACYCKNWWFFLLPSSFFNYSTCSYFIMWLTHS